MKIETNPVYSIITEYSDTFRKQLFRDLYIRVYDPKEKDKLSKYIENDRFIIERKGEEYYHVQEEKGAIKIPSGLLSHLEINDEFNKHIDIPLKKDQPSIFNNYQKEAIRKAIEKKRGIIKVGTGGGKSACMGEIINHTISLGKVIIVVPTKALFYQTKESIEDYFSNPQWRGQEDYIPSFSFIGDGKKKYDGDIIIALPKSLNNLFKKDPEFIKEASNIKTLLLDEIDQLCTPTMWEASTYLNQRIFSIGLSATPKTSKTLDLLSKGMTGSILIDEGEKNLIEKGNIYEPDIRFYSGSKVFLPNNLVTQLRNNPTLHWIRHKLYNQAIVNNTKRNQTITNAVKSFLQEDQRPILIMVEKVGTSSTKQVSHARVLKELLDPALNLDVPIIHGATSKKKTEKIFNDLRTGNLRVALCGPKALSAGVNIPIIGGIVLAGGGKMPNQNIQRIGRCLRLDETNKKPIVIDIMDENQPFKRHSEYRLGLFKNIYGEHCTKLIT